MTGLPAFGIPHSNFPISLPTSEFKKVPLQLTRWRQQVKDSRNLFDATKI
jgi:hypothetical protein